MLLSCLRALTRRAGAALALASILMTPWALQAKDFNIAPAPGWINPVLVDWASTVEQNQVSDGVHYLLSDIQVQIAKSDKVVYRRSVATALNARGVESLGHVEIGFDPSYQTLTLHSVVIHRAGQAPISKLNASAIRILQREKELEYRIFDGTKTANLFLDDLRVGDSVEFAYSLTGTNPVFSNRQFGRFDLQWQVPITHVYRRLIVPTGRQVGLTARNTALVPKEIETAAGREYIWDVAGQPALIVESEAPGWFDPYAAAVWSEFDSWGAVARWAEPMYRVPARLSPALQREVDRIAATSTDPGERMLAALRFVQGEVRYLGVEVGAGSYAPNPPQLVFERRFGDCKDKTMLLVSLLHGLGIPAQAALVHTVLRKSIAGESASPGLFNHVITRAQIDGKDYWLDATRARQQGTVSTVYQPDFGVALVVAPNTTALTKMPAATSAKLGRSIQIEFDMRAGYDQPARMTVKSIYKGGNADGVRNTLSSQSRDDLQQRYLNFYARTYPGIQVAEPFTDVDDAIANQVTVTENYWVKDAWKPNPSAKRSEFVIHAADMNDLLTQPKASIRKAPLAQQYPVDLTLVTNVLLPDDWKLSPSSTHVDDPAFEFEQSAQVAPRQFTLTNHFVSRTDQIAAVDVPAYAANLKKADNSLGYQLYHRDLTNAGNASNRTGLRALPIWLGAVFLGLWVWLAWKLYQHDPAPPVAQPRGTFEMPLNGIGGWLVLAGLGLIASPIRMLYTMRDSISVFASPTWAAMLTSDSTNFDPLLAVLMLVELVMNLGLLTMSLLLIVLFFKKRTSAPKLFIGFVAASALVQLADAAMGSAVASLDEASTKAWGQFIRSAITGMLWSAYFLRSRRVRETFIVRLQDPGRMPAVAPQPMG